MSENHGQNAKQSEGSSHDLVDELRTGRGVNEGPMRDAWVHAKMQEAATRIEQLEAALREVVDFDWSRDVSDEPSIQDIARAALDAPSGALEGKP